MGEWWETAATIGVAVIGWYVAWRSALGVTQRRFAQEAKERAQERDAELRRRAYEGPYELIKGSLMRATAPDVDWFSSPWRPDPAFTGALHSGGLDDPWHAPLKQDMVKVLYLSQKEADARGVYNLKFRAAYAAIAESTVIKTTQGDSSLSSCRFTDVAFEDPTYRGNEREWTKRHYESLVANLGGPGRLSYKDPEREVTQIISAAFAELVATMLPTAEAHRAAITQLTDDANRVIGGITKARTAETYYQSEPAQVGAGQ